MFTHQDFCNTTPSVMKLIWIGKIHPRKAGKRTIGKKRKIGLREITLFTALA